MNLDERVRAALAAETRFSDIRLLAVATSTNRVVSQLAAEGAPEGVVVAADWQTAGRGRLERRWDSEPGGGLLVSVLVRPVDLPPARLHLVTSAVALAARSACRAVARVAPGIKWPNDLLLSDGKLAGILAESSSGAVVVGMGMNVHSGPPGTAVLDRAAGRRIGRGVLLEAWLRSFDSLLGDWEAVALDYRSSCITVGRDVSVELPGGRIAGHAVDVDDEGRLVVRLRGGGVRAVAAGDVTHVRPATAS